MQIAIKKDFKEIIELLLAHPNLNINNYCSNQKTSALIEATRKGNHELVKKLLSFPSVDVNYQDKFGQTAVMYALLFGKVECLRILAQMREIDWYLKNRVGFPTIAFAGVSHECRNILTKIETIDWNMKIDDVTNEWWDFGHIANSFRCSVFGSYTPTFGSVKQKVDFDDLAKISSRFVYFGKGNSLVEYMLQTDVNAFQNLLSLPNVDMNIEEWNKPWDTYEKMGNAYTLDVLQDNLGYETLLEKAFEECKKHVAKLMNLGFEESSVLEITYKATFQLIIFALQKNLSNDIVKILFAGAETQDIVDLVIYAASSSGQHQQDLGNPRKKIRLDEE